MTAIKLPSPIPAAGGGRFFINNFLKEDKFYGDRVRLLENFPEDAEEGHDRGHHDP
jgi:hypothetical protein